MYQGVYLTNLRGFSAKGSLRGMTICQEAIDNGFLKKLKGLLLPCYLYLATRVDDNLKGQFIINNAINTLACTRKDLLKALISLEEEDFIELLELDPTSEKRPILFSLKNPDTPKEADFIESLLQKGFCQDEELVEGLVALYGLPHGEEVHERLREEIEEWFKVFDQLVIKEILQRSYQWGLKNKEGKPFQYLTSILEELKEEGVLSYEDLQKRDNLYHKTRELARSCGIKAHELQRTPIYKQILKGWITPRDGDDFALPLDVACFGVEEATRRSSSRHPSLDYIENNFILPWREARIETIDEARRYLKKNQRKDPEPKKETTKKSLHDQFAYWAQ